MTELLDRAPLDQEFHDRQLADPEANGRAFDLPAAEVEAIKHLDRRKFEAAVATAMGLSDYLPLAEDSAFCGTP